MSKHGFSHRLLSFFYALFFRFWPRYATPNENGARSKLAYPNCNLSKAIATAAVDPKTGEEVPLFNPRTQVWIEHFEWVDNYALVLGVTPIGRATESRFKMNRPRMVLTRQRWVQAGLHPVSNRDDVLE